MRVTVLLTRQELDAPGTLAATERRPPRDQAGYLIAEGLVRRGLLPPPPLAPGGSENRDGSTLPDREVALDAVA